MRESRKFNTIFFSSTSVLLLSLQYYTYKKKTTKKMKEVRSIVLDKVGRNVARDK